jgi:hypothetical protein
MGECGGTGQGQWQIKGEVDDDVIDKILYVLIEFIHFMTKVWYDLSLLKISISNGHSWQHSD